MMDTILAPFMRSLARARRAVLFLDFDGTLAPLQADPEKLQPYPGVPAALDRIMDAGHTRLVVVTGLSIQQGLPQLGTHGQPEIWGSHGRERQVPGRRLVVRPMDERSIAALATVDEWADELESLGARCELKAGAFAVHWQRLAFNDRLKVVRATSALWEGFALRGELVRRSFDGGIEFRVPGWDKADVVRTVLSEEMGNHPCAYLGDDETDEDAFAYLRGRGVTALVRRDYRPTSAAVWLVPPGGLLEFIADWNRTLASAAR